MSDYIKREDAIFIALQQPIYSVVSQIKQLDGIDIVRCGECKWWSNIYPTRCKRFYGILMDINDFCSYGQRAEQTEPQTDCSWK